MLAIAGTHPTAAMLAIARAAKLPIAGDLWLTIRLLDFWLRSRLMEQIGRLDWWSE